MGIAKIFWRPVNAFRSDEVNAGSRHTSGARLAKIWERKPAIRDKIIENVADRASRGRLSVRDASRLPEDLLRSGLGKANLLQTYPTYVTRSEFEKVRDVLKEERIPTSSVRVFLWGGVIGSVTMVAQSILSVRVMQERPDIYGDLGNIYKLHSIWGATGFVLGGVLGTGLFSPVDCHIETLASLRRGKINPEKLVKWAMRETPLPFEFVEPVWRWIVTHPEVHEPAVDLLARYLGSTSSPEKKVITTTPPLLPAVEHPMFPEIVGERIVYPQRVRARNTLRGISEATVDEKLKAKISSLVGAAPPTVIENRIIRVGV